MTIYILFAYALGVATPLLVRFVQWLTVERTDPDKVTGWHSRELWRYDQAVFVEDRGAKAGAKVGPLGRTGAR